ncbi:MAG: 6-bladed beta-propeller [Gemmatimonadota bacterium]
MDTLPGGAVRVLNPADGIWSEPEQWRIVEDLRIGRAEGIGPDVFGRVSAVGISPQGSILVIDGQAQEVRVFDGGGDHVRTIGRKGSGPGEFQNAHGLAWDDRGRLWVADAGNNRYSVFDSLGNHLFERQTANRGVVFPWLGGFGRDGFLYEVGARSGPTGESVFTYFRMDSAGAIADSLPKLENRPASALPMALFGLAPRLTFRFDPAGHVWFGFTSDYRIYQRSFAGDTLRIIERAVARVPVTEQEKDSIVRELAAGPPGFGRADIPATMPAFDRIFVDSEGHLLIHAIGRADDRGRVFDVFDAEGRYLGPATNDVTWTIFPVLPVFARDHVLGVTTDSLGIHYVVRARIQRE